MTPWLKAAGLTLAGLVLSGALAGCGWQTGDDRSAAATTTVDARSAPARTEVACLDVTGSVPRPFVELALSWFARRIASSGTGPAGPAVFYLRETTAASYSSDAAAATVRLPAIPLPPPLPVLPDNPYERQRRDEIMRTASVETEAWRDRVATVHRDAAAHADALRNVSLPTGARSSDILGCAAKAGELLAVPGDRLLFVAGDLAPTGPQQTVLPRLNGAPVMIAFWCSDDAATCTGRRDTFVGFLLRAGAGPVTVLDAQQIS